MNSDQLHPTPPPIPQSPAERKKIGFGLIIGVILSVGFNAFVQLLSSLFKIGGLKEALRSPENTGQFLGMMIGGIVIFPLIIMALFLIGKSFRNARSLLRIFMITSLVLGLLSVFQVVAKIGTTVNP